MADRPIFSAGAGSIAASSGAAPDTGATFDVAGVTAAGATINTFTDTATGQAGTVALGSKTLTVSGAAGSFSGGIAGTGGLTLAGGAQILSGASPYADSTVVSAGTLTIENGTALGAADGAAATGTTVSVGAAPAPQGGIAVGDEALSFAGLGLDVPVNARGLIGYRRAFGDVVPRALMAFAGEAAVHDRGQPDRPGRARGLGGAGGADRTRFDPGSRLFRFDGEPGRRACRPRQPEPALVRRQAACNSTRFRPAALAR
ncbi:hypothetical protein [Methylobacterium sp. P5_C11]